MTENDGRGGLNGAAEEGAADMAKKCAVPPAGGEKSGTYAAFTALFSLTVRNVKVFVKDKANVFFSLLAPLIALGLYVLFIGRMQSDGITEALAQFGVSADDAVRAFSDSWMLSGVMATSCITVPLCACGTMIQDKNRGVSADFAASPIPSWLPSAAYFLSVAAAGLIICLIVLGVCFAWLAISGSWLLSAADAFACIGVVVLSVLASSALLVFIVGFVRSEGAFTGINIIFGTLTGFLTGAYIPVSTFPEGVQYVTLFVPGSYSAALFRTFFMDGALGEMSTAVSPEFAQGLSEQFSVELNFFGSPLSAGGAAGILAGTAILFGICCFIAAALRLKKHIV